MTMLPSYRVEDPQEVASNLLKLFEESTRAMSDLIARFDGKLSPYSAASEMAQAAAAVADIAGVWLLDPDKLVPAQGRLLQSYLQLWENSVRRLFKAQKAGIEPLQIPDLSLLC
jgi:poly[(R)-3-hydroxyalkanoate] polymerase subunit PhaC